MKIIKIQVLRGPNRWSNYRNRLIQMKIDLEEMEQFPSDKIQGFAERFMNALPAMVSHECSEGRYGGFFERLRRGTWMGHIIEHTALEIQSLAGMENGYGRTRETIVKGVYNLVFSYTVEEAGLYAAKAAFRIVDAIAKNEPYDIQADIDELKRLKKIHALGPSTQSIVDEAVRRGIPWHRIGKNSKIQLGYGANQMQFQATMTSKTSDAGVRTAGNKEAAKILLRQFHIPVAPGGICSDLEELTEIINTIGFPIVIKPLNGNHGRGASINVNSIEAATFALAEAQKYSTYAIVERFVEGFDFRVLVIDGKFVAAAKRVPAHVIGNGIDTIEELITKVNLDPKRGDGHESVLTKITVDGDTHAQLNSQGLWLNSIPDLDKVIYLKSTANISTGGTAIDYTDEIHPANIRMAQRIAKIVGLDICGIDIMSKSLADPLTTASGAVLEVNAAPGFRMHLSPSEGKPRNVAAPVIDMLYPSGKNPLIPIFAVTGTNGKTTTTRMLAHITENIGFTTGYTTTDGIYIGGDKIHTGDTTGPNSARTILNDPTVEFAVLETARGGLLRSGLAFDCCDVAIITNIEEDHLGLNDINTLDELANVKAVVARSVKREGWAVLNASDYNCVKIAKELRCNIAYFSLNADDPIIKKHISAGLPVAIVENNCITIKQNGNTINLGNASEFPITQNGTADFMIANLLATALAANVYGFTPEAIKSLVDFKPSYEQTPGRMNLFELNDFNVLVDYAHNPHGLAALKKYLDTLTNVRKIGIVAGIGDRRPEDTKELAAIAATMFDHVIVRQEHSLRGNTVDGINALVIEGLQSANPNITFDLVPEEGEAIEHALKIAGSGDILVALSDDYETVIKAIKRKQSEEILSKITVAEETVLIKS